MSEYYHLRIDTPKGEFAIQELRAFHDNRNVELHMIAYYEISDKGKAHLHCIILLDPEDVQPLRNFMQSTYKKHLKATPYWEATYAGSKKVQVYSLQQVRKPPKIWTYIAKDGGELFKENWNQEFWDFEVKKYLEKEQEEEDKLNREIDEFWENYKIGYTLEYVINSKGYQVCSYLDAVQSFHNRFGDIKNFRVKFLRSAYKHNIIDFNTYLDKMYRL